MPARSLGIVMIVAAMVLLRVRDPQALSRAGSGEVQPAGERADIHRMLGIRHLATVGIAVVTIPLILNYGLGYINTIERIGNGEEVASQDVLNAGTQGIRPGQTSAEVERLLAGDRWQAVPSEQPGESCRGYDLTGAGGSLVVCFGRQGTGADERWLVTRAAVRR